jgi:hypothetical protein
MTTTQPKRLRRKPVEAIEHRTKLSAELELRVRKALTKLVKTGAPFTVEDVCNLACVGKTFIYDKRRAELTSAVLAARDASQREVMTTAERDIDAKTASWRERTMNAESLAKELRAFVKERDARIAELTGQLYDPEGSHLADQNAELRKLVQTLNHSLLGAETENRELRRSLDASRANVRRERERNVTLIQS